MRIRFPRNPLSLTSGILLIIVIITLNHLNKSPNILAWDVFGYYLYLPLTFIYRDLLISDISIIHNLMETYDVSSTLYQIYTNGQGGWIIRYSIGISLMNIPFFFLGHIAALLSHHPVDGFSVPYQDAIWYGAQLYSVIGLLLLRKILLNFFSDRVSAFVMIVIVLGTNYLFNVSYIGQNANPQNYGFTFYAIIVYLTILWHRSFRIKHIILMAIACGLLILSRFTEIVCLLIPLLWGVYNRESYRRKIAVLKKHKGQILVFMLILGLIGSIQIFYWLYTSGKLMDFSYSMGAGGGMDFFNPHVLNVLFSFRKGWFLYTPVAVFPLAGLVVLYRKNRDIFYSIVSYLILNLYLVSAWTVWWYAECFGQRALIPSLVLLAIPMGYLLEKTGSYKKSIQGLIYGLLVLCIVFSLFKTWQYNHGILHGSRVTRKYYLKTFLKTRVGQDEKQYLLVSRDQWPVETIPDESRYVKTSIYQNPILRQDKEQHVAIDSSCNATYPDTSAYLRLDARRAFSPGLFISYEELTDRDHLYVRASADFYIPEGAQSPTIVMAIGNRKGLYKYTNYGLSPDSIRFNQWNHFEREYLTPEVRWKKDKLQVYIWHTGTKPVYVKDLRVDLFNPIMKH